MWQKTKNIYHFGRANFANLWYLYPGRGVKIIGVTGTDGKTTTASLIYHVLREAGYKAALVTSVAAVIDGKSLDIGFHVTTPRIFALRSLIKKAKKQGAEYIVLEVTSHSLDQHRVHGVPFAIGVLTNVTREHLDYHKTYEKYVNAKAKLLKHAKVAILNKDDHSYFQLKKHDLHNAHNKMLTYGMKKDSDINPHVFRFETKLLGVFNKYNCLAAIAALQQLHISEEKIRKGIASFKPPVGRQEIVYNKEFTVINDFAHTPNSFAMVLPEVRKMAKNRLIHVFGSAAKRDKYKRPEMGKLSSNYSDIIVLTSEDPRDEGPEKIMDNILSGISNSKFLIANKNESISLEKGKKYIFKIPDRKEAIAFAIGIAQKGDVVLMTGKGHEKSMNYGRGEEPWDETKAAKEAIALRSKKSDVRNEK